jgi:cell division transport system ATP-binding protein
VVLFENVGLRYGTGPEILKDVSFALEPHSFHFLSGPSGAGKTTLLKLILQGLKPSSGRIRLFGRDVSSLSKDDIAAARRRIGVVLQDFKLLDHLTVYENVALALRVQGVEEASYRAEVIELLKWVGLGERMDMLPVVLSGGEKQRTAIARALIVRPEILLADEPTGNVDPQLARRLLRLFIELNKLGTAIVLATHDFSLMEQYEAPRMVLAEGRVHVIN